MLDVKIVMLLFILFVNCIFQPLIYSFLRTIKTRVVGEDGGM